MFKLTTKNYTTFYFNNEDYIDIYDRIIHIANLRECIVRLFIPTPDGIVEKRVITKEDLLLLSSFDFFFSINHSSGSELFYYFYYSK